MKIYAFKMETDTPVTLDTLLSEIKQLAIVDRVRNTASGEVSLKEMNRSKTGNWLLDFTKFRHVGPGKAAKGRANEDFDLKDDEFFGEETAALYYPSSSDFVLQMNHFGPRGSSIEQYLRAMFLDLGGKPKFNFSSIRFSAIMRNDQAALYKRMQLLKTIEFKMYVPGALQTPQTERQSVSNILSNDVVATAQDITIKIQAIRSGALNQSGIRLLVKDLLGMRENVTRLTIKGAESSDETAVLLDLLECQLMVEKPITATSRKRHALNERWGALRSAYDEWKSDGHL